MGTRHTQSEPAHLRGRRRGLLRAAVAVGVLLLFAGALVLLGGRDRLNRVGPMLIAEGVGLIARGVSTNLGHTQDRRADNELGLRRYDPALGGWVALRDGEPLPQRAVVLVHGLDEPGSIWDQLAPALHSDGHDLIRFDYRNDQAIARSTDAFADAMARLESAGVSELDLVCHSMGGLVARDWLTHDDGYPQTDLRVGTLITLGTPHHGSAWARLRAVAEVREQVQRWAGSDDMDPARLLGFMDDGSGGAGVDLLPGSDYLTDLNARPMPAGVRVVCVVGRTDQPSTLPGVVGSASARAALRNLLGEAQARTVLDELDRLGRELGDGVVPVSSAVMDGADEVVRVRANHRSMIRTIELEEAVRARSGLPGASEPPAIEIVRDRLARD